jgi:hypothetical protein
MTRLSLALAVSISLLLGACASSRSDKTEAPAAPAKAEAETAAPATPPVPVPAASARKLVLAMTGPKKVTEAKDWADFKKEWRDTFAEHAKQAGIAFSFVDGEAKPQGEAGTLLAVQVDDYRMVGIGARIFFGVMTGNAFIDAKLRFLDLRDGKPFGEQQHNTTSSAWSGVFAKVTPQQVDAIATDVFKDLKAAK